MIENPNTNSNAPDEHIDELLNCYIDDELTAEQKAEVENLIDRDAKIAQRMRQFQKCRILLGSMPVVEAPASVLDGVNASLADIPVSSDEQPSYEEQIGKKPILLRKVLAAAAVITLAAVLSMVINKSVPHQTAPVKPAAHMVAASGFSGRLELKTNALNAVDAFIKSAIDDYGLTAEINTERRQARRIYSLSCSRENLNVLLANLDDIWSELDSATLFVNTDIFGVPAVVDDVTTKQIAEIAGQESMEKRIELAKDYDVLNNIAENLPDKEIRVAIEAGKSNPADQLLMSKPVLTGPQKSAKKQENQVQDKQNIHLTIILDW